MTEDLEEPSREAGLEGQQRAKPFPLVMLEILDCSFVGLGGLSRVEGTEIAAAAGFGVLLSRVQAILA